MTLSRDLALMTVCPDMVTADGFDDERIEEGHEYWSCFARLSSRELDRSVHGSVGAINK
jgi:hypothetical protein